MKLFLISMGLLFLNHDLMAEYRVYQYFVKPKFELAYDKNAYIVTTTFDPVTYIAYNGGAETIKVDLIRTWMCSGHTGASTPVCLSPTAEATSTKEVE